MKHENLIWIMRGVIVFIVLALVLASFQAALANVRIENGGETPFYARLARDDFYSNGTWVVIVFYRPPDCEILSETNFNLLDFFDFVNVWECQQTTTDGFDVWKNGPEIDMAPIQIVLFGNGAVPVWFVSHDEMLAAISDDELTIGELAGLRSLKKGSASFYHEVLHPYEGAVKSHIEYDANGTLEDGTSFKVHVVATEANYGVDIKFK